MHNVWKKGKTNKSTEYDDKSQVLPIVFTQDVKHLVYMGIAVRKFVQQTVKTMSVMYRKELVLDVLPGGWTQFVSEVWSPFIWTEVDFSVLFFFL